MKYTNFRGEYLEVENNRANWAKVIVIVVICGFLLIIFIGWVGYIYCRIRKTRMEIRKMEYIRNHSEVNETPYENTDTNNGDFYEPPPPPGNLTQ